MSIEIKTNYFPIEHQKKQKISSGEKFIPEPHKKVAKGMEERFLLHMIKQMKKSVQKSEADSTASDFYNSQLDSERAKILAEKEGGVGIQKLILNQIYPIEKRSKENLERYQNLEKSKLDAISKYKTFKNIKLHKNQGDSL